MAKKLVSYIIDVDIKDCPSPSEFLYRLSPKLERIVLSNCENINFLLNPIPGAFANLKVCLLERVTLAKDIIFSDIPLETLVLNDIQGLEVILLQRLTQLKLTRFNFTEGIKLFINKVRTVEFQIDCPSYINSALIFEKIDDFDIDILTIQTPHIFEKILTTTPTFTKQPIRKIAILLNINGITSTAGGKNGEDILRDAIIDKTNFTIGKATHLKLLMPDNIGLLSKFKKEDAIKAAIKSISS